MFASTLSARSAPLRCIAKTTRRGLRVAVRDSKDQGSNVVREFSESSDEVTVPGLKKGEKAQPDGTFFIDQAAEPTTEDVMSKEMKTKLRDEYVAWGGAPSKPLANNPFLLIMLVISALAVAAKLSGALDGAF